MSFKVVCAKNDTLERYHPQVMTIPITITSGAPTLNANIAGFPIIMGTATNTAPLTQAAIDAFLGSSSEVVAATAFGSTAMGTDSMGFVINMNGQCAAGLTMRAGLWVSSEVEDCVAASSSALTDALSTAWTVTSAGNIYGRTVLTGLDAATCVLMIELLWLPK